MLAKETSRNSFYKLNLCIKAIQDDLHAILADPSIDTNKLAQTNADFLMNKLEHLERVKVKN
jgi:hypothetical protein